MNLSDQVTGVGFVYSVGFQREIWKERLRFNPNFGVGHYNTNFFPLDAGKQNSTLFNLGANLHYDLAKNGAKSLVVACGGLINHT